MYPSLPDTTRERHDRGFTIVEFVVVIAILAIIAVAVVFSVGGSTDRNDTSARAPTPASWPSRPTRT